MSGSFPYTVTTTGPCVNPSLSGTITVNADATISLSSAAGTDTQTKCINIAITNITYAIGGGGTGATVAGLPTGVNGAYSAGVFTISGTPSVSGTFNYTVTTVGPCIKPTASGTITVQANSTIALSSGAGTNNQTRCINVAMANITFAVGGGATGATVVGLPSGVAGSYSAGVFTISGTPTVSGSFPYTITTTGPCVNPTATGTITVNDNSTITLTSAAATTSQTLCQNTALTSITYAIGGGGTGVTLTGTLPAGVTGSYNAGTKVYTISGTPTAAGSFSYTVTTTGPCINPALSGTITVNNPPSITTQPASQTVCNASSVTFSVVVTGTPAPTYQWNKGGSPIAGATASSYTIASVSAADAATYTVVVTNSCGTVTSNNAVLTVNATGQWLGGTAGANNWFIASNWCGGVPSATTDVIIPAIGSVPNQPGIGGAGAVCRSITINGSLTMTGAFNLDVNGDWTNNGTFTPSTSSVTFKGASNNTMAGTSATTFYNLIVNKTATANTITSTTKAFTAGNNLTVTQGDLILQATDANYTVTNDIIVPVNGILTHSVQTGILLVKL